MTTAAAREPGFAFLAFDSFAPVEGEAPLASPPAASRTLPPSRSPFVSVYEAEAEGGPGHADPRREAFAALVDELHDDEFEAALAAVQGHGRAFHDTQLAAGMPRAQADRLLVQHFEPLLRESAAVVDAIAQRYVPQESAGIVEHELEAFADSYTPAQPLAPAFEQFFGKLVRKVRKVAKAAVGKAWQGIKTLGLAPLLRALKAHLMGFLKGAVERVLGKIPSALQPAARQLAGKLGFPVAAAAEPAAAPAGEPATPDSDAGPAQPAAAASADDGVATQQELDEQLAGTLLAHDEAALEGELAAGAMPTPAAPVYAELDDAREHFIEQLAALKDGESAEPAMQQFLPAVLPALRVASKLIGHKRLAGVVAKVLAPLIGRLIGPQQAPALAQAIASAGLKALSMEAPEDAEAAPAASAAQAVAATVEETLARVAALPEEVLQDSELLEAFTLEAFEAAAAANLPAVLPEAAYAQRPELLEGGLNVSWPMLPARGGPRRYKRCSQVFSVSVSPYLAAELETFEGAPLEDFVQDQLGLMDSGELEAEVHLYEALAGTTLADIAHGEAETLGSGFSNGSNVEQLHPLTPQAAAALLGKPGLGRAWRPNSRHRPLAAGQRFYALRLAGAARQGRRLQPLHLRITLDMLKDEVRACVFVSEVKAQHLAVQLRQQAAAGALATRFQRWLQRRLWHLFFGFARHRLRIVHAALPPGQSAAQRVARLPQPAAQAFAAQLRSWLVQGFADAVRTQAAALIAATEDAADGITLRFTVAQPPGLKALGDALAGKAAGVAPAAATAATMAQVQMIVTPGHRCGG